MNSKLKAVLFSMMILMVSVNVYALSIVTNTTSYGYGTSGSTQWTNLLDTATGNNVTQVVDFNDLDQLMMYDALLLNTLPFGYGLSQQEIDNLRAYFEVDGHRGVFMAENHYFTDLNGSIEAVVDGQVVGNTTGPISIINNNEITYNVNSYLSRSGSMWTGGESFDMLGTLMMFDNILVIGDGVNIFDDAIGFAENTQLANNTAQWLASAEPAAAPVPEPASIFLLGAGLIGMVSPRIRKKFSINK